MMVTLATAKLHLGETDDQRNAEILARLAQAEAMVLAYLARPLDAEWTAEMATWGTAVGSPPALVLAPAQVQAAILVQLAELDRFRGDDPNQIHGTENGNLSDLVKSRLIGLRKPVFA